MLIRMQSDGNIIVNSIIYYVTSVHTIKIYYSQLYGVTMSSKHCVRDEVAHVLTTEPLQYISAS